MRLARMKVLSLFGLFDHEINFNLDEHITILHAPNGFGKTVMLKLIAAFFGGTSRIFTEVEFREIRFDLSDGSQIYIRQNTTDEERSYRVAYTTNSETKEFDTAAPSDSPDERHRAAISSAALQQYLPFLRQIRPGLYRDLQSGRQLSYRQVIELYWKELPPRLRSRRGQPDWLRELRASVHCRLIETQRLLKVEARETGYDNGNPTLTPVVRSHAESLQSLIRQRLAESATLSQTLDRTFPARLIRKQIPALSESHLRERLSRTTIATCAAVTI